MKKLKYYSILILVLSAPCLSFAQKTKETKHYYFTKDNVAILGYDVISYFDNDPKEGKSAYRSSHEGVTYLFSSSANQAKFEKTPKKYLPKYGGWCAYAMGAKADKVKIDPETYKIISGELYLFYNFYFNNTLNTWNEDEQKYKEKADVNWKKIIK